MISGPHPSSLHGVGLGVLLTLLPSITVHPCLFVALFDMVKKRAHSFILPGFLCVCVFESAGLIPEPSFFMGVWGVGDVAATENIHFFKNNVVKTLQLMRFQLILKI